MKLCSRLLVLYCRNCPKDDKFRYLINWSPFWGSYERRRTLVDGSLERTCRLLINCNWTSFSISYRWRATRQNVSKLTAFWRGGSVQFEPRFQGEGVVPREYFLFSGKLDILLSDSANCTVLHAVVLKQYRCVTDGQTEGRNCYSQYSACLQCEHCSAL